MNFAHSDGVGIVRLDDSIWVTGGGAHHSHTDIFHNEAWSIGPDLPSPMKYHSAVKIAEDKVLFVGSRQNAFIFDANFQRWEKVNGMKNKGLNMTCGKAFAVVICLDRNGDAEIFDINNRIWWDGHRGNALQFAFSRGIFIERSRKFILLNENENKYVAMKVSSINQSEKIITWKSATIPINLDNGSIAEFGNMMSFTLNIIAKKI